MFRKKRPGRPAPAEAPAEEEAQDPQAPPEPPAPRPPAVPTRPGAPGAVIVPLLVLLFLGAGGFYLSERGRIQELRATIFDQEKKIKTLQDDARPLIEKKDKLVLQQALDEKMKEVEGLLAKEAEVRKLVDAVEKEMREKARSFAKREEVSELAQRLQVERQRFDDELKRVDAEIAALKARIKRFRRFYYGTGQATIRTGTREETPFLDLLYDGKPAPFQGKPGVYVVANAQDPALEVHVAVLEVEEGEGGLWRAQVRISTPAARRNEKDQPVSLLWLAVGEVKE